MTYLNKKLLAICSKLVIGPNRQKIRFMHRDKPMNDNDSGWQFYSGQEGEIIEPNEIVLCPLERICEMDPSIKSLLNSPEGSAWERIPEKEIWEEVKDFQFIEVD